MISANEELKQNLAAFSAFSAALKGDEKSEAQTFLEHLFRAFGHAGVIEAGATFEFRVAKKPGSSQLELLTGADAAVPVKKKGGTKFADLLWPGRVLIEMKSRGLKLEKHYDQLFDYWSHIVPHRPQYAILCNFDEIWIYDFTQQLFDPVDRIPVAKITEHRSALTFLSPLPNPQKPVFDNNRVEVTRKAADIFATVFRGLLARKIERPRAQRFILQLLVSVVAEDLGLLPDDFVTHLLGECAERPADSYELLGGLFRQMADARRATGGRYKDVPYFNGGLFDEVTPIELKSAEAHLLHDSALRNDWAQVKPEIFGTIFQQSMDEKERHAFGAHFTSEFDIQKVVGPTITRPWRARIAAAGKSLTKLRETLRDLRTFRVLDPACGSGNFLFVAYREIKRLERDLLVRLRDAGEQPEKLVSAISLTNFFGLDIVPFAVELAKVTLMLAKELELREAAKTEDTDGLHLPEQPLPLDNLDSQILLADALFTPWPKADAIIGNPPYLDARKLTMEHGADYTKTLRKAFPAVPGRADFVVYFFRKAHDCLAEGGRAGMVGTNTIRQNNSREGGLDYVLAKGGTITDAVSTQVWSGDAAVHVSIVNWIKGEQAGKHKLVFQRGDAVDSPWETFELERINSALSAGTDLSGAIRLTTNGKMAGCFEGQQPGHDGFRVDAATAHGLIKNGCAPVVFAYLNGDEMLSGTIAVAPRYILDFGERDTLQAREFKPALDIIRTRVVADWKANAAREKEVTGKQSGEHQNRFKTWWQLKRPRQAMLAALAGIPRYVVCARVTKRPIFSFLCTNIRPDSSLSVFPFADDYSFGILQSSLHFDWFKARCSTLKADYRYTSDTVFDTFPWPQAPTKKQLRAVADAAVALRTLRREVMAKLRYSLRDLYRTLEDPGDSPLKDAHDALDAAVRAAYESDARALGVSPAADPLAFLLALNHACAAAEAKGQKITPPGLPLAASQHAAYLTSDCIPAPEL